MHEGVRSSANFICRILARFQTCDHLKLVRSSQHLVSARLCWGTQTSGTSMPSWLCGSSFIYQFHKILTLPKIS
jgi:hypothetical protein